MYIYSFLFSIIVIFNYLIGILAENGFYVVSIRRSKNDKNYDEAPVYIQNAIDNLVNDRMNDIYDIIEGNRDTYVTEDGTLDEKMNEFDSPSLQKRNVSNKKFRFLNPNYPKKEKRSNEDDDEYIDFKSDIVYHVCPVSNYYVIRVYLSDVTVEKVKKLPNVIYCHKDERGSIEDFEHNIEFNTKIVKRDSDLPNVENYRDFPIDEEDTDFPDFEEDTDFPDIEEVTDIPTINIKPDFRNDYIGPLNRHYNISYVLSETNWSGVTVQQFLPAGNKYSHLSLISQYKVNPELIDQYDNNYYFPSTAGKNVNIYFIDTGIFYRNYPQEFNPYFGTIDQRTITCDAIIVGAEYKEPNMNDCLILNEYWSHGTKVAAVAAGTRSGVAKKANIHVIAADLGYSDDLLAMDFVLKNGVPHKTIINISRNGWNYYFPEVQDKIDELINAGFIIIVSAGNNNMNACQNRRTVDTNELVKNRFAGYENVITVSSTADVLNGNNITSGYKKANYTNFGKCIDFFAPGQVNYGYDEDDHGTSFSTPIVTGVAALVMGENPDFNYTQSDIRKILMDMSIKDIVEDIESEETPNYFINNGKHIVYSLTNIYYGCGVLSGNSSCSQSGYCCTKDGKCIDPNDDILGLCDIENGCQSEFGYCNNMPLINVNTTSINIATETTIIADSTLTELPTTTDIPNDHPLTISEVMETPYQIFIYYNQDLGDTELPLGVASLDQKDTFNLSKTYYTWMVDTVTNPSFLYLSKGMDGETDDPSGFCLDLSENTIDGLNYLSLVQCQFAKHKFMYGGSTSNTIAVYDLDDNPFTINDEPMCLYYNENHPRIFNCNASDANLYWSRVEQSPYTSTETHVITIEPATTITTGTETITTTTTITITIPNGDETSSITDVESTTTTAIPDTTIIETITNSDVEPTTTITTISDITDVETATISTISNVETTSTTTISVETTIISSVPTTETTIISTNVETTTTSTIPNVETTIISIVPTVETTTMSIVPTVETTTISTVPTIETTTISNISNVETTTLSAVPTIETSVISTILNIETTTISVVPTIETTTISAVPTIETTIISAVPTIETTTISAVHTIEITTISAVPTIETTTISAVPTIETSVISTILNIETTTTSTIPAVETTTTSIIPIIETTTISTVPIVENTTISPISNVETTVGSTTTSISTVETIATATATLPKVKTTTTRRIFSTPKSYNIKVKFRGTMKYSKYFLGINRLIPQKSFNIYELDNAVNPAYQTWIISSKTKPSIYRLSSSVNNNRGHPTNYCLDLGSYANNEGYNYLSIVNCSEVRHKFKYGGTYSKTIDIYNLNNVHLKDRYGYDLCLYYSMTPRISRCKYINDRTNNNAEHMKWDILYV